MEALLVATRDRLRSTLSYPEHQCEVQPDGRPMPSSGEVFLAVHPAGIRQTDDYPHSLDEEYDLTVTLSVRVGYLPTDRHGKQAIAKYVTGLYARAEAIRAKLHGNYTILTAANASTAIGSEENGFIEPLKLRSISAPLEKGPDWFFSDGEGDDPAAGYALEIAFHGARRKQVIEEQS